MSRIHRVSYTDKFNALSSESRAFGETNDCAVKAIALVCDVPYATAHAALMKAGRRNRKGTYHHQEADAIRSLGFVVRVWLHSEHWAMIVSYGGKPGVKQITTHHPARFPKAWRAVAEKRLLMFVRGHVAAVVDGVCHDWSTNNAKRVVSIWEVTKVETGN